MGTCPILHCSYCWDQLGASSHRQDGEAQQNDAPLEEDGGPSSQLASTLSGRRWRRWGGCSLGRSLGLLHLSSLGNNSWHYSGRIRNCNRLNSRRLQHWSHRRRRCNLLVIILGLKSLRTSQTHCLLKPQLLLTPVLNTRCNRRVIIASHELSVN